MAIDAELSGTIEFRQENRVAIYQPLAEELEFDESVVHMLTLAAPTDDLSISLGGISTATFVYIESDNEIKVTLNGAATEYAVKRLLLTDCSVTSMSISNDGADPAEVKIIMAA